MKAQAHWLSPAEAELLIEQAVAILERTGMRFAGSRALDELEAAGARVDREAGVARLPRDLVARALARCPSPVLLAGATPEHDCLLDGGIHFVPSGSPTVVLDMDSGEYRRSTLEDVRRAAIVADAVPEVDILWALVSATDEPPGRGVLTELLTQLAWSPKHVQHEVTEPWMVEPTMALLAELCGGLDAFRERPRASFVCCTSSPLAVDGAFLDTCIDIARYGAPILVYPMPIAGATAPLTVAGTVAMNVAEFLGVTTALQVLAPGTPVMMGAGTSLLDMHATTFSFGAVETALMCAACVEVGHRLGVPVLAPGLATDAKDGGIQAGYEKALKGLTVAAAGADLITGGIGLLSGAGIMSLPQIVIDAEIAAMIKRLLGDVDVSAATVMADVIDRVGFHGHFLGEKDTSRRLRAGEVFMPTVSTRLSLEQWQAAGRDEAAAASERVREILAAAEARGPRLEAATLERLTQIVDEAPATGS